MEPNPINLSHLSVHRLPARQGETPGPFVYDKGTATVHLGDQGYLIPAQVRQHPLVSGNLRGPIYSGLIDGGSVRWMSRPGANDAASIAATLSRELGIPLQDEHRLASLRCPTCGDPIETSECPRCDWGRYMNVSEDATSDPIDPTTGVKSDFVAQSSYEPVEEMDGLPTPTNPRKLPFNPEDVTPSYGRERNVYYHVAPTSARESILQNGLMAHDEDSEVSSPWESLEHKNRWLQPNGNYLFDHPESAFGYTQALHSEHANPDFRSIPSSMEGWSEYGIHVPYMDEDEYNPGAAQFVQHPDTSDWTDDDYDNWYETGEDEAMVPYNHEEHRHELPPHMQGYDIWKVRTDPTKHRILQDPESALTNKFLKPQEAINQVRPERDGDWYSGDKMPSRWYSPDHIGPEQLSLHNHVPLWEIPRYPDAMDWPGEGEDKIPAPLTQVPIQRYFGRTIPDNGWYWPA